MNASNILVPSGTAGRTERSQQLWDATHERMERFLPGFLDEIIPPVVQSEPTPSQVTPEGQEATPK